ILVYRTGSLGDTVIALPALWALKQNFPSAEFHLLSNQSAESSRIASKSLFEGSDIFAGFIGYPLGGPMGRLGAAWRSLTLLRRLRSMRFDAVAYLAPSNRTPKQVRRDRVFFRLAGIRNMLGARGFSAKSRARPMLIQAFEADCILGRLAHDGLALPPPGGGSFDLKLGPIEEAAVDGWLDTLPTDGGRAWLGVGPGSGKPATRWPEDRYAELVGRLIRQWDLWPVVFGGKEDFAVAEGLLAAWGRGYNACGALGVRDATAAMRRCHVYVGNDSGPLHLAASVGVPCVGVYSARDIPGEWYPYGEGHIVLRKQIDCEGCGLTHCVERHNECTLAIEVGELEEACGRLLGSLSVKAAVGSQA
ncbi:MAG TPA: glycosyltransferase family 9 protein, partial [bacterium]|nr:glycosyltransferase family 9 protein [bacterium]